MKQIYLFPGQLIACREPALIKTILGSCVGVALFDRINCFGGLNHYLLPEVMPGEPPSPRYGTFAIETLFQEMLRLGSRRQDLQAKIFGGAAVLGNVQIGLDVGIKNIEAAVNAISGARVPLLEKNVGGTVGRQIVLRTDTFEVSHRYLSEPKQDPAAPRRKVAA